MSNQHAEAVRSGLATRFSIDLFQQLVHDTPDENVFISPLGMATALAMTLNGATGDTYQAMAETLGVGDLSLEQLNAAYKELFDSLASLDDGTQLKLINSLWGNQLFTFRKDFLGRAQETYNAWLSSLDFSNPASADQINGWVSAKTDGRIKQLVRDLDALTVLVLINVAMFKGTWTKPFDERQSKKGPFTSAGGKEKQIQRMNSWDSPNYFEDDQVQVVQLPYGSKRTSMLVALPREDIALADVVAGLTPEKLGGWIDGLRSQRVDLSLPRFKVSFSQLLNDVLSRMGMAVAFDANNATFEGMQEGSEPLCISAAKQDTFLSIDENGTEAVAASVVIVTARGGMGAFMEKSYPMVVDRPFLIAIVDSQTGAILFVGAINDPQDNEAS